MPVCVRCRSDIPVGSAACPACGAAREAPPPVRLPARGASRAPATSGASGAPRWVWRVYRAVCVYWIAAGALGVARALASGEASSPTGIVAMGVAALGALVGIGLLLHIEVVRGVVNVLSFLKILSGLLGFLTGLLGSIVGGMWGVVAMLTSLLDIATGGLMIFLIGETDTRAPDL